MRVATYTWISTDEAHQPYSLDAQAERLASYIASQDGWTLVREFTDQKSGATLDRPGLRRALREAQADRYDLLLVYRVDRLARSTRGLAHILEELDQAGAVFRSATEPFDTATPAGRMMVQMLGVFAEFERATIIDRVIAGMERKAATGEWTVGTPPYGYQVQDGALVVNEREAALVPVIFDMYGRQRLGARAIANWLNEHGHRTKQGRPWSQPAVLTVLRNRAYIGQVFFRGRHHPGRHQPLIEAELFATVEALTADRAADARKRHAAQSPDFLLGGLIVCQRCQRGFVGTSAHGNRYQCYTCFSRQRYGTTTCAADRLPAPELDQAVLDALLTLYDGSKLFTHAITSTSTRHKN
jgi:site-specific DNA recombinase